MGSGTHTRLHCRVAEVKDPHSTNTPPTFSAYGACRPTLNKATNTPVSFLSQQAFLQTLRNNFGGSDGETVMFASYRAIGDGAPTSCLACVRSRVRECGGNSAGRITIRFIRPTRIRWRPLEEAKRAQRGQQWVVPRLCRANQPVESDDLTSNVVVALVHGLMWCLVERECRLWVDLYSAGTLETLHNSPT